MRTPEEKLNIEAEIAQSMLYGDFKNYLVAIIVPDHDQTLAWAKENNKANNRPVNITTPSIKSS